MRTRAIRSLAAAWLLYIAIIPALAGELNTLKLRVDGKVAPGKPTAVADGRDVYLPIESLKQLGCTARVNHREDAADVRFPGGESAEIALARLRGELMVPFSAIRSKLHAELSLKDGECDIRFSSGKTGQAVQNPESIDTTSPPKKTQPTTPPSVPDVKAASQKIGNKIVASNSDAGKSTTPARQPKDERKPVVSAPNPVVSETASQADTPGRVSRAAQPDSRTTAIQPSETLDADSSAKPGDQNSTTSPLPRPTATIKAAGLRVKDVALQSIDGSHARLRIATIGRPAINARLLSNPSRLVIDLPNCGIDCEEREWKSTHAFASEIHAVEGKPGTVSIVVDLARLVTYRILSTDSEGVTVNLASPRGSGGGLDGLTIAIDPGHGGSSSTGCSAGVNGHTVFEKQITLAVAKIAARILQEEMGANVIMTRTRDEDVGLKTRPTIANDNNASAFISFHVDDFPGHTTASGSTAYYHMDDESGRALAHSIVERVAQISGLPNRGSRSDRIRFVNGMAVLRYASMPATLVEMAYISNPGDRAKLLNPEWQEKVARAVCNGIRAYFEGRLPEDRLGG